MDPLCVLAGGFGTRLREAVPGLPKPLAPVVGRPYLGYLLDRWVSQGVRSIVLLLHHQAELIECFIEEQCAFGRWAGCRFDAIREVQPLGTGGSVANAVRDGRVRGSFLVANADTWLGEGVEEVAASPVAAMALVRVADASRYGRVRVTDGHVIDFEEKRPGAGEGWINAGLYRLDQGLFDAWNGEYFSLETGLFPKLASERKLHAVCLETSFIDIGIPTDYQRFCRWVETGMQGQP